MVPTKVVCLGPTVSPHFLKFCDYMTAADVEILLYDEPSRVLTAYKPAAASNGLHPAEKSAPSLLKRFALFILRPFLGLLNFVLNVIALRREVRRHSPDLIQVHWLWKWGFLAVLTGKPVVLTAWGSDIEFPDHTNWLERRKMYFSLSRAQIVTAPSQYIEDLLTRAGVKSSRIRRIVFPGIDVGLFENASTNVPDLDIPLYAPVIFSPRALDPFYRIHTIISAFKIIRGSINNAILVILDYNREPPGYLEQIRKQIDAEGLSHNVLIFENMPLPYPHMPALNRRSTIAISVPEGDGVPSSCLEAMAAGCPIVSSDLSTYDGILDHEDTCLRVRGTDPLEIANACIRLWKDRDLRERIVVNARKKSREIGDIHMQMSKFVELYKEIKIHE